MRVGICLIDSVNDMFDVVVMMNRILFVIDVVCMNMWLIECYVSLWNVS